MRRSHLLARLSALAADLGALLHQLIAAPGISESIAVVGTFGADFGALAAQVAGVMRSAGHEPHRCAADRPAVFEQPLMFGRSVFAAQMEAMVSSLGADDGALGAVLHAGERFFGAVSYTHLEPTRH